MREYIYGTAARKKVVEFPKISVVEKPTTNEKKGNYKVGEKQEVYPFRTEDDLKAMHEYFVNNKQYRDDLMFVVGVNVGLRAGDLLALKWGQVFDEEMNIVDGVTVKEEKTDKFRTFYLNNSCKNALMGYYERLKNKPGMNEYIFKSRKGNSYIEVRPAGLILKKAANAVGIKYNVGTHSMRKTFGYWQLKAHADDAIFLCELQEMFNHSSPKITLRYCGLESEKTQQYYNDVNLL